MQNLNEITSNIIGAAIAVHKELGPGLLESTYEACLIHELKERKLRLIKQKNLPVHYKGIKLDSGYRIDLLVEDQVIVEIKAAERILPVYEAQLLSYLKLSACKVGLLINFNVKVLKNAIRRVVYRYNEE